jgi:acetoin utilization deacetylase AcuC-like enzyme
MKEIGICTSTRFVEHYTGQHHPERPDRIRAISTALVSCGLMAGPNPFPNFELDLGPTRRFAHPLKELDFVTAPQKWLHTVHPPRHVMAIQRVCELGGGVLDQGDTLLGPDSFEIAMLAVGAVLRCCDAVMTGQVQRAFASIRPPGHHAEPDRSMGFCLFSNVAIAARYIQRTYDVARVAIVDFDVHHGNGTQACFEDDPTVLFISLHQHPRTLFPGTGFEHERGIGPGEGFTINIPFNPGSGDEEYLSAIERSVLPALESFRPEVLLISAGFDAHRDDPLANIELSDDCFEVMTALLAGAADRLCGGRLVSVLEGGYHLRALGRSVIRHLAGMGAT